MIPDNQTRKRTKSKWYTVHQTNEYVLPFWKNVHAHPGKKYGKMPEVARKYLAVCGSAAMSERVWSRAGFIWTDVRSRLGLEKLQSLIVMSYVENSRREPQKKSTK